MARQLIAQSLRLARCWNIMRTNADPIRITDHNKELTVAGVTYSPVLGFSISTTQTDGEGSRNVSAEGVISSTVFTFDDFRAGLFKEAKIVERVVDWKYPWHGEFSGRTRTFWFGKPVFDNETFSVPLESAARFLTRVRGKKCSKLCPYKLFSATGNGDCNASTVGHEWSMTVTASSDRRTFTASGGPTSGDVDFVRGEINWTAGSNVNMISNIRAYTDNGSGSYTFELALPLPYDIAASDTATVRRGCDRRQETCHEVFNNITNFGGEPETPGFDVASNVNRSKKN